MSKKSLEYNAIQNIILTISNILFPLITFPYISRIFTVEGLGKVNFYSTFGSYALMVAGLGIGTYGIKACAIVRKDKGELSKTVMELLTLKAISTGIVVVVMVVCFFSTEKFRVERILFLAELLLVVFGSINIEWFYSGIEEYSYITKRSIAFKLISLVLLFLLVKRPQDYVRYVGILVFANCGNYLFNIAYSRRFISYNKIAKLEIRKHIKPMLSFFGTVLAVSIYTSLDTLMLGFSCGDEAVGYYTVAVKVKSVLLAVINSISAVLLPRLSYYAKAGEKDKYNMILSKSSCVVLSMAIPVSLIFILNAANTISILSGEKYKTASFAMSLLMLILVISGISNITGNQILIPNNMEKNYWFAISSGAIVDFVLNLVLIPRYSYNGVAVATVFAELVQASLQLYFSRNFLHNNVNYLEIGRIILSSIISTALAGGALWCTGMLGSVYQFIISGIIFMVSYSISLIMLHSEVMAYFAKKIHSVAQSEKK